MRFHLLKGKSMGSEEREKYMFYPIIFNKYYSLHLSGNRNNNKFCLFKYGIFFLSMALRNHMRGTKL